MDKLIAMLVEKTGIDEATAKQVAEFVKNHAADIPVWLGAEGAGNLLDKAKGFFDDLAGKKDEELPQADA